MLMRGGCSCLRSSFHGRVRKRRKPPWVVGVVRKRSKVERKRWARWWSAWFSTTQAMSTFTSSSASFIVERLGYLLRGDGTAADFDGGERLRRRSRDRKSTRLNSS